MSLSDNNSHDAGQPGGDHPQGDAHAQPLHGGEVRDTDFHPLPPQDAEPPLDLAIDAHAPHDDAPAHAEPAPEPSHFVPDATAIQPPGQVPTLDLEVGTMGHSAFPLDAASQAVHAGHPEVHGQHAAAADVPQLPEHDHYAASMLPLDDLSSPSLPPLGEHATLTDAETQARKALASAVDLPLDAPIAETVDGAGAMSAMSQEQDDVPPAAEAAGPRQLPPSAVQFLVAPQVEYPRASRRLKESGRTLVSVYVDEAGLPRQVLVKTSSGFALLDEAALAAVRKARFKPYMEHGQPTAGWVVIPMVFDLER